ncbi:MAG TPA: hypothetical protein VGI32_16190 [Steroidobacteraceae bacterium]|jgi:hypothetical protein
MNKERDLLPWIFGGLSAAAIAVAFAAVSSHRAEPALAFTPTPVVAAQAPALPAAVPAPPTASAPSPAPATDAAPMPAPPPAQAAVPPTASEGQIWACTTNGVKTYSNNPCGEKSTLLDVGPVNTMSATPAIHYARPYGAAPSYQPGYADQGAADDSEDYAEQYPAEAGGNSYAIVQGVRFAPRKRPDHFHRAPSHHNPGQNPGHNSGPSRRN